MRAPALVLGILVAISIPLACKSTNSSQLRDATGAPQTGELAGSTQRAGHGMAVFGTNAIYMYHLPMWSGVHAWNIVIEAELSANGQTAYTTDRAGGSTLNTFNPQAFALKDLAPGFSFRGTLFHGHFEQGGNAIANQVTATVRRVILVKHLNPDEAQLDTPLYRVFGKGSEWYGAHIASHNPDFDQVVALQATDGGLTDDQLASGVNVTLPGQTNNVDSRPQSGTLAGQLDGGGAFPFSVTGEAYFSTSDLGQ